jgi:chorismate synthase
LAGNSIGKEFVISCFGESHGRCVGVVVDGCPAGLPLSERDIQRELNRRIPSDTEIVSARVEKDNIELLSGVFNEFTTGAPICTLVWNREVASENYEALRNLPRPGHADYPARTKYGSFNDYRGGGRFSGRMTVGFVMAGAIAKRLLALFNIEVLAYTKAIGAVSLERFPTIEETRENTYKNHVRCPDINYAHMMKKEIMKAKRKGDSLGGVIECLALNVPVGVGEPLFDSLDSDIAKFLFDIPAVKGVEIGAGFKGAQLKGSENNDSYSTKDGKIITLTNKAGGILGGISSGMPIMVRLAVKPTPSISREQRTVDLLKMEETKICVRGRHDPCIVPKAVPVVESGVAIVLVDQMLRGGLMPKVLRGNQ